MPVIFLISMLIPLEFQVGALLVTPLRIVLLVSFIPLFFGWLANKSGEKLLADFFLLGFVFWSGISFLVNTGSAGIEAVGISTVETIGSYLLGRTYIRSVDDLSWMVRIMFYALLFMLPAAIIESTTTIRIYSQILEMVGSTFHWVDYPPRWGLFRAQVLFEHPILYGIFCALTFSLFHASPRRSGKQAGLLRSWLSVATTFFSLSAGPLLMVTVQIGLTVWGRVLNFLKGLRWSILIVLVVIGYVVIDLLSNRTPFQVFASYLTFNTGTAYYRILIFEYGMQNVWANPWFGLGQGYWVRPSWMNASVDNFWLLLAMRYGIPSFVMFTLFYFSTILRIARVQLVDPLTIEVRRALVFTFIGLAIGVATVHIWGATYGFVLFLLGATSWIMPEKEKPLRRSRGEEPATESPPDNVADGDVPASRFTRQKIRHKKDE